MTLTHNTHLRKYKLIWEHVLRPIPIIAATLLAGLISSFSFAGSAQAQNYNSHMVRPTPQLYVAMYRADWCAPCKVVEPRLQHSLTTLNDPEIEFVMFDISNPSLSEISAHRAFDRNIVKQYNLWLGVTGFAAIIDADTKTTLGCVSLLYDQPSMTNHIANLKNMALRNQASFDLTCPEPNN